MATYAKFFSLGGGGSEGTLQVQGGLPLSTSLQRIEDQVGNLSPLQLSTDEIGVSKSSTATTQDTAVIKSTDTNAGIAIVPNGNGAFTLQVPDGTGAGGNARGDYAVDLQTKRGSTKPADIASGTGSSIIGGYGNQASGDFSVSGGGNSEATGNYSVAFGQTNSASGSASVVSGGYLNAASGSESGVVSGRQNQATGYRSFIGGGFTNVNSSTGGTISGGQYNTASTNSQATVVGGSGNTSTGQYSVSGGYNNTASNTGAVALGYSNSVSGGESPVALGRGNTVSGFRAVAIGDAHNVSGLSSSALGRNNTIGGNYAFSVGESNNSKATYSISMGNYAVTEMYGSIVNANGIFQYSGDAQVHRLLARKQDTLTTGGTTVLSLDGTGTTNLIDFGFVPDRTIAMRVRITWSAGINDALTSGLTKGDCIGQTDEIMIKKLKGGFLSIVGTPTVIATNSDASMASCTMNYTVSGYDTLTLTFQGPTFGGGGNLTARVLANIEATQCVVAPF